MTASENAPLSRWVLLARAAHTAWRFGSVPRRRYFVPTWRAQYRLLRDVERLRGQR